MAVFLTLFDVIFVFVVAMGGSLIALTILIRFVAVIPDSIFKAAAEIVVYTSAVFFPGLILWWAFHYQGNLLVVYPAHPWESGIRIATVSLCFATWLAYTLSDIHKLIMGRTQVPEANINVKPCSYSPNKTRVKPILPAVNDIFQLRRVEIDLTLAGISPVWEGLRIGHLTDFHVGHTCIVDYLHHAVDRILESEPELLFITGDFVNFRKYVAPCFEIFQRIEAPLGVYVVRGNHDYWVGAELFESAIADCGFHLLHDRTVEIHRGGEILYISGLESPWNKSLKPLDFIPNQDGLRMVLAHTPDEFPRVAVRNPHLVISGHTHGGQICFPVVGPVVVPSVYGRKYAGGFYRQNESLLYVSRGIGCYPPFRLLCPPEVTLFQIHTTKKLMRE